MRSLFCEKEVLAVYLCPDGHSVFVIGLPLDRHIPANKIAVSRMSKRLEKGFENHDFHAYGNDAMIELLKSGKINNRLLCEMAAHACFSRFMADMEIYVDGIASMQIQSLNSVVDMARIEIEERYHPAEDDRYIQTLQAAHIDEDGYFTQLIHEDIDTIAKDLHAAHIKDSDTAPAEFVGDELRKSLEAASEFKGSADEKKLKILCDQLGINYDGLSEDEFKIMIKVLGQSKKLKSIANQRGKSSPYQKHGKGKRKK